MTAAISVDQLSKRFRITATRGARYQYRTLRESVADGLTAAGRRVSRLFGRRRTDGGAAEFWALRDVSFRVEPGEVLGIIGHNGAGKSTALKILSRITKPTAGEVRLRGRVGSLLEVGTGFHPELTGRENVYLNGSILGMSRREVQRKFDEIVQFAEVERFLDTPVKRYSSGMYVRLAFAVAAHLEPEILIVDEVLAVGDMTFQKKCLGKMNDVSRHGRTILFVSHNMLAVKSLCTRAILLEQGRVRLDGDVDEVVDLYLDGGSRVVRNGEITDDFPRYPDSTGEARVRSVRLTNPGGREVTQLYYGQPFRVQAVVDVTADIPDGLFEVSVSTTDGIHVLYATTMDGGCGPRYLRKGRHEVTAAFDSALLPRAYSIDVGVHHQDGTTADLVSRALDFTVLRVAESGDDHYPWPRTRGMLRAPAAWSLTDPS
jgi:lipopolysaccharide transport system ATP-binding protein